MVVSEAMAARGFRSACTCAVAWLTLAGCPRQAETLDDRDFTEPCTASCEHSFGCDPEAASQVYADVQACIEDCNDNTLPQWSEACAEFTRAAWECNATLTCEQSAAANDDPQASPCAEHNDAFIQCVEGQSS